jgi:hypothetical protein
MHLTLSAFVLLIVTLACVLSSQPTMQTPPTMDPLAIESAVAGTAQAAATQTAQAIPISPTATIAPTATITATPKVSLAGTALVVQEDQSTLFIDYKLGFQLIIPTGWLTIRVNEEEFFKAFTLDVVVANPVISDRLRHMQNNNPDYFRLDAFDIRSGHIVKGMASSINVVHQPPEYAKTLEECLKLEKETVRASAAVGHKILSSKYQQTTNGTRVLVVEESWSAASDPEGKVFARRVFFELPSGITGLDLQTHMDFKDTVLPDFEQAVNSVTLLVEP